jgi:hypothetical protein
VDPLSYFENSHAFISFCVYQGEQFIDINKPIPGKDRRGNLLGVDVYESYDCKFGLLRNLPKSPTEARLTLTVDLRAKIPRTESVLDDLHNGQSGRAFSKQDQDRAIRAWTGEQVIYTKERKGMIVWEIVNTSNTAFMSLTQFCPR